MGTSVPRKIDGTRIVQGFRLSQRVKVWFKEVSSPWLSINSAVGRHGMSSSQLKTANPQTPSLHPTLQAWMLDGPLAAHVSAYAQRLELLRYASRWPALQGTGLVGRVVEELGVM